MKIRFRFFNFILAAIYAVIYDYVYCNYMYGVWETYVDGSYSPMNTYNYIFFILIAAFPFVFYEGLRHIASAFSLFVYVLVYIPFVESLFVNGYPDNIRISYSFLFFVIICAFFLTDHIYTLKKLFKRKRKLISFNSVIVLTFLLLAIELFLNYGQLHLVNFFAADNDLYSLREGTHLTGIYFVCWLRSALLPLLLVYYLNRKSIWGVSLVIMAFLSVFMLDKQKMTVIFPFALIVIHYAFLYYEDRFGKYFHIFLIGLFAIVGMFFTIIGTNPITLTLGMILVLRIQCIAGVEFERYFDFFIVQDNPFTYYTHISVLKYITGMYPYGELSIGEAVAGNGSVANATFLLMDGLAAAGMIGCVIISIIFIFFKTIMNSLDAKCNVGICVTILLFGIQSMMNLSLMTAILSNGFLLLFLLFLYTDVSAVERVKNTKKRRRLPNRKNTHNILKLSDYPTF